MITHFSLVLLTSVMWDQFQIGIFVDLVGFRVDIFRRWLGDKVNLNRRFICAFYEYRQRKFMYSALLEVPDT